MFIKDAFASFKDIDQSVNKNAMNRAAFIREILDN